MKAHTKLVLRKFEKAVGGDDPYWFEKIQQCVRLIDTLLPLFKDAFKSRERMVEIIDSLDPNDPGFPFVLEVIDGLPRFGRHFANEVSLIAKQNTPAPRPGRKRIPAEKETAVINFIQDRQLRFLGETLSESQQKAAAKYKVSARTARRVWDRRSRPHITAEDISKFLMTQIQTLVAQNDAMPSPRALAEKPSSTDMLVGD